MRLFVRVARRGARRERQASVVAAALAVVERRAAGAEVLAERTLPASSMLTAAHLRGPEEQRAPEDEDSGGPVSP